MAIVSENTVLEGRYQVGKKIGEGAQGTTWRGRESRTGAQVVIKELLVSHAEDWKSIELFEREGATLRAISHPAVPRYIEALHVDEGGNPRFLIVQEFVGGQDLQKRIDQGSRMNEVWVREFLRQMGEVLEYLHGLSPAVIHRDIKPSNIIRRPKRGDYALIDFGAVQAVQPDTIGGSTVVGTSGYMPAEQLIGRAVASSDLYALAATAVHLATGVFPSELPVVRMRIQYRDRVKFSNGLMDLLDAMLEPSVGLRLSSAGEMLEALKKLPSTSVPVKESVGVVRAEMERAESAEKKRLAVNSKVSDCEKKDSWMARLTKRLKPVRPVVSVMDRVVFATNIMLSKGLVFVGAGAALVVAVVVFTLLPVALIIEGIRDSNSENFGDAVVGLLFMAGIWAFVWYLFRPRQ